MKKKACKNCALYPPKCIMCRFYDKEEVTAEERKICDIGPIKINRAKCPKCEDIVTSDNRHDFKRCKCESIFVDGGSWYARRGFQDGVEPIEMSERYADAKDE